MDVGGGGGGGIPLQLRRLQEIALRQMTSEV